MSPEDLLEVSKYHERLAHSIHIAKQFSSRTAHDFNNVIAVMQGFAGILQNRLQQDEKNRVLAEQIDASGSEALKLTNWLAAFANNTPRNPEPLNLNHIVVKFLAQQRQAKPPEVELETSLAETLPLCEGDETQLEELCRHLWENALDAMPEGGKLSWETECLWLPEQSKRTDGQTDGGNQSPFLRLRVCDTGIGMDEATRSQVFDPFFTTKAGKGRGLGLTVVYDTVRACNGFVSVSSSPVGGTCIDVHLPAQIGMSTDIAQLDESPLRNEPVRVLIIDDEDMIRTMLKEMLTELGYDVVAVGTGEEALAAYQQSESGIDAVVLDLGLSGMTGEETFNRLKDRDREVKIIVATGDIHQSAVHKMVDQGVAGVLSKPFSPFDLRDLIEQIVA